MTTEDTQHERQPERPGAAGGEENDTTSATPPRGNPETDRESVEKGEEQLDRVVGN
jgi:hypothetical protein